MLDEWSRRARAKRVRERAIRYVVNGWPVAPLAIPRETGVDPWLAGEVVSMRPEVDTVWAERGWGIALVAHHFEVMELPPEYGALLNQHLKASCPTAMAPVHRRWWFFLEPGSVGVDRVTAAGGVLHRDWVAAPGTRLASTGQIRWLVHPYQTRWRPYRREDPIEVVLGQIL